MQNWVYVMLSRGKTHVGLFCRKALSKDLTNYPVPETLQRMLQQFCSNALTFWSDDEYDELFNLQ
jgi:hypothetical protein